MMVAWEGVKEKRFQIFQIRAKWFWHPAGIKRRQLHFLRGALKSFQLIVPSLIAKRLLLYY